MFPKQKLFIIHKLASWGIYYSDDKDLIQYLNKFFDVRIVNWIKTDINELRNEIVLIRHPENYLVDSNKFLIWLSELDKIARKIVNPFKAIKHNINKKYLFEIEKLGIRIIPSLILKSQKEWERINWDNIVIKPLIGESGLDVVKVTKKTKFSKISKYIEKYGECLVQKFLDEILLEGEISCIFINGKYTHSVIKKTPSKNNFKTHWKLYSQYRDEHKLINNGIKILKLYGSEIYYARMDWIRDGNDWCLLEIELIDPVLYISKLNFLSKKKFLNNFHLMLKSFYE